MSCFTLSRNMHFFFFLVLTTLMTANPSTSTSSAPTKDQPKPKELYGVWHIHVVNGLSNNKILFVHCKSGDDDLGMHNLTVGSETQWRFRQGLKTLFWCFVASRSDHVHAQFDVFWQNWHLFKLCDMELCIWTARDDGIYLKNLPKKSDEFQHNWEKDTVLLTNSTIA